MSMKTRSQTNSDIKASDNSPTDPPVLIAAVPEVAPSIASIEVNENSQAFLDALDRALLRLMGSRDDAAKVPAVYTTGDITARTDQPYSDQSSSRNPLDRSSARNPTHPTRRSRIINDLTSTGSIEKNYPMMVTGKTLAKCFLRVGKMTTIALPMKRTIN